MTYLGAQTGYIKKEHFPLIYDTIKYFENYFKEIPDENLFLLKGVEKGYDINLLPKLSEKFKSCEMIKPEDLRASDGQLYTKDGKLIKGAILEYH